MNWLAKVAGRLPESADCGQKHRAQAGAGCGAGEDDLGTADPQHSTVRVSAELHR